MSIVVKNVGASQRTAQNNHNTAGGNAGMGDQGTVTVYYQNVPYVFGPNESKSFGDDGIGAAVAARDARLRVLDTRDSSWPTSNASVLQHRT